MKPAARRMLSRLRQPSTWAALGVLATLAGHRLPPDLVGALPELVGLVCAGLGVALDETGPT